MSEELQKKLKLNIFFHDLARDSLKQSKLTITELKVYLELSLEYQLISDAAPSYQMAIFNWNRKLPELLQKYTLTMEEWERISNLGDETPEVQDQLASLIEKITEQ